MLNILKRIIYPLLGLCIYITIQQCTNSYAHEPTATKVADDIKIDTTRVQKIPKDSLSSIYKKMIYALVNDENGWQFKASPNHQDTISSFIDYANFILIYDTVIVQTRNANSQEWYKVLLEDPYIGDFTGYITKEATHYNNNIAQNEMRNSLRLKNYPHLDVVIDSGLICKAQLESGKYITVSEGYDHFTYFESFVEKLNSYLFRTISYGEEHIFSFINYNTGEIK